VKIAVIYNWIILAYLSLVTILTLNGNIAFGNGLGDLVYLIACGLLVFIQLIVVAIIIRQQKGLYNPTPFYWWGSGFLLAALFLSWKFTLGRGSEYSWDGNIFYHNPF
jgi:hypothetical protein